MNIVFLHGFTGAPDLWKGPGLAPPLLGHAPEVPGPSTYAQEVARLHALVAPLAPVHLIGYSMGSRLALGLLAHDPTPFAQATLIAVNPGLSDPAERAARVASDERWARLLETEGTAAFLAAWDAQPLFAGRSDKHRARRLRHDPAGLAAALRGLGLGVMPDLWPALPTLALPVHYIAGALDTKFCALVTRAAAATPGASLRIVPGVGHDVPLQEILQ